MESDVNISYKNLLKDEFCKRQLIIRESHNSYYQLELAKKVILYHHDIWCPDYSIKTNNINDQHFPNSCFSIKESTKQNTLFKHHYHTFDKYDDNELNKMTIVKKIKLHLTHPQRKIIKIWMDTYTDIYNLINDYYKEHHKNKINVTYDSKKIRKIFKTQILNIINMSSTNPKHRLKIHDAFYAIRDVCKNYKSTITNKKNGNIKRFNIRNLKKTRPRQIVHLEKNNFKSGSIRLTSLGNIKGTYNGKSFDFKSIDSDCTILIDKYNTTLLVPYHIDKINDNKPNKMISLDPGLRTFMTGITENKIVEIGNNMGKKITKKIEESKKIKQNENIPRTKKAKLRKRINVKIHNMIDEMHWKTINYLTLNYSEIFIGNLSTKQIVSNRNNNQLSAKNKNIAMHIRLDEFRQRLRYKCESRCVKYKSVDEKYTSMMCSECGRIKWDLGDNKKYRCDGCGMTMKRDVNGSRMIYIRDIGGDIKIY